MAPGACCRRPKFEFDSIEAMSCAPNRSGTAGPLFLLNHWVSTSPPSVTMAARANAVEHVAQSAPSECAEERGKLPNIILVDFHDRGDLFKVVDALNKVGARHDRRSRPRPNRPPRRSRYGLALVGDAVVPTSSPPVARAGVRGVTTSSGDPRARKG